MMHFWHVICACLNLCLHSATSVVSRLAVRTFAPGRAVVRSHHSTLALSPWCSADRLPNCRGSGTVDVVYLDESLRVFRSKGSVAVQMRADLLQC